LNNEKPIKLISGYHGKHLGVIRIITERIDDEVVIIEKKGWIEPIGDYVSTKYMDQSFDSYHRTTLKFIRKEISSTQTILSTSTAYFSDNPLIDLINNVQLEAGKADISFASCFNNGLIIEQGSIKIKDIYSIYPYENFLYTLNMTGKNIKDYLEHSARFFNLFDDDIEISEDIAGYNYDISEGISYTIDLTQPPGSRIKDLTLLSSGEKIREDKFYSVALNSFRGSGGGGYLKAIGLNNPEVISRSNQEIRNMIIEFLERDPNYDFITNNNWKIQTE